MYCSTDMRIMWVGLHSFVRESFRDKCEDSFQDKSRPCDCIWKRCIDCRHDKQDGIIPLRICSNSYLDRKTRRFSAHSKDGRRFILAALAINSNWRIIWGCPYCEQPFYVIYGFFLHVLLLKWNCRYIIKSHCLQFRV